MLEKNYLNDIETKINSIIFDAQTILAQKNIFIESGNGDIKNHLGDIDPLTVTDLTYLKSNGGEFEIKNLCENAIKFNTKTVCVNSINVPLAIELLKNSNVKVICVEGFPLGSTQLDSLIFSTNNSFNLGVSEVDIVFPHLFMNNSDYQGAINYLTNFRKNVNGIIKVIFETSEYSKTDIAIMSLICKKSGVDFVKTSTGFSSSGATPFDVALMRKSVGNSIGVKASGGIKTIEDALNMINHGATRIGASGLKNNKSDY